MRPAAIACALLLAPGLARAQDGERVETRVPVRQELVEWLLDMGKLYRRAHADDQLVIFRKLWVARDAHQEVQVACQALGTKLDGALGELYATLGVPADAGQRDPFAPSEPDEEALAKLLGRAGKGELLVQVRTQVRFLRALDALEPEQPAALARLRERYPRNPWLIGALDAVKRWDGLVAARDALERAGVLPAPPPDGAPRVRVFTGDFERPEGGAPSPVAVDGWLVADEGDQVTVRTDFLSTATWVLGERQVPLDLLAHAGGPLPRFEELDPEAAAYERLGGGIKSYAGQPARRAAGSLTYGQETLLQALDLWARGRRGLAARLFELAEAIHDRDADRASGQGLVSSLVEALRAKAGR